MNIYNQNADIIGDIENEIFGKTHSAKMHIRLQQRNTRKSITILEGAPEDLDLKASLRKMKKKFSCGGALKKDTSGNTIMTLAGDHRKDVVDFFVDEQKVANKDDFVVHGY